MTTTTECRDKHTHINWIFGVVLTLITAIWAVFIPIFVHLYAAEINTAEQVQSQSVDIGILQDRYQLLMKISDKQDMMYDKMVDLDKKLSVHMEKEGKLASNGK